MLQSEVIIRPMLTEKSNKLSEKFKRYTFQVHREANKIEIKKAVEALYNVSVIDVNTLIAPAKNKSRFTRKGMLKGRKSSYKKAIVILKEGETIDIYAE